MMDYYLSACNNLRTGPVVGRPDFIDTRVLDDLKGSWRHSWNSAGNVVYIHFFGAGCRMKRL